MLARFPGPPLSYFDDQVVPAWASPEAKQLLIAALAR